MPRKSTKLKVVTSKDLKVFENFLEKGTLSKDYINNTLYVREERITNYLVSKLIEGDETGYLLTKKGFDLFNGAYKEAYEVEYLDIDTRSKEVNLYIMGDLYYPLNKQGFGVFCFQLNEYKKFFSITEEACKSPHVIMLKSFVNALNILKEPCIVNVCTYTKIGLKSCFAQSNGEFKRITVNEPNFELKYLCQLTAMKNKHKVNLVEETTHSEEIFKSLQQRLYDEHSDHAKWHNKKYELVG